MTMSTSRPPLRIGDIERDAAAAALSEHYANGRLTKSEYDERLGAIWAAKFDADLGPLFADLPRPGPRADLMQSGAANSPAGRSASPARGLPRPATLFWLAPLMMIGFGALAFAVLAGAPWVLFVAFWLFACGGFGRRHGAGHRYNAGRGAGYRPGPPRGHQHAA
jgi:hypothetical protein